MTVGPDGAAGRGQGGALDRALALALLPPILAILAVVCPIMLLVQGRPLFYASERMKSPHEAFRLWKLRTMHPCRSGAERVLGGDALARVTPLGRVLRGCRIDELPQIVNILRGDIRFIGPRPPLPRYVADFPNVYADILSEPPGVTGLATVVFHRRESRILSRCPTLDATEEAYRAQCIPRKARLDRFYRRHRCLGLNALILLWTFTRLRGERRGPALTRRLRSLRLRRLRSARRRPRSAARRAILTTLR